MPCLTFKTKAQSLILGSCLCLSLALPASAQVFVERFVSNSQTSAVSGPYQRYFRHILKLSSQKYAVLFEPGFADIETARRAVSPLCGSKSATAEPAPIPVDLVIEKGESDILHGVRVSCR